MALWKKNNINGAGGIRFQARTYKPRKYHIMTDPEVATAPFDIDLDEDKCIGCGVCIQQCPSQTLAMKRRAAPSALQSPACQCNCPAGIDVREYLKIIADGASFDKAWKIITNGASAH